MGETIILQSPPKDWVDIMQALLTPAVAFAAVWIAYWQFRINTLRLKHELFDRRIQLYQKVQDAFGEIIRDGAVSIETVHKLARSELDCRFLFGDDVGDFVLAARDRALDARQQGRRRESPRSEEMRQQAIDAEFEAVGWLIEQPGKFQKLVTPYMALNEQLAAR